RSRFFESRVLASWAGAWLETSQGSSEGKSSQVDRRGVRREQHRGARAPRDGKRYGRARRRCSRKGPSRNSTVRPNSVRAIGRPRKPPQLRSKISSDCFSVSSTILPSTSPITNGAGEKP